MTPSCRAGASPWSAPAPSRRATILIAGSGTAAPSRCGRRGGGGIRHLRRPGRGGGRGDLAHDQQRGRREGAPSSSPTSRPRRGLPVSLCPTNRASLPTDLCSTWALASVWVSPAPHLDEWDRTFALSTGEVPLLAGALRPRHPVATTRRSSSWARWPASVPAAASLAYDASKAGLIGLSRHVAVEGARRGIRANGPVPGLIDTPARPGRRRADPRAPAVRPCLSAVRAPMGGGGSCGLPALGRGELRHGAGDRG